MSVDVNMRVKDDTRDRVMEVAKKDYGGVSVDQTIQRLLDEHWERQVVDAVERYAQDDPKGYAEYLSEADDWANLDAPIVDEWVDAA